MKGSTVQPFLFDDASPAAQWQRDATERALDELFTVARKYTSRKDYGDLLRFVAHFRFYSPFNAMLVHIQMPGATFVAPAYRWERAHDRRIKAGARPLVILQPMGPVMFVFDVSDTEPASLLAKLPKQVEQPFEVRQGKIKQELPSTIRNARRDGIHVVERDAGSQDAGLIRAASPGRELEVVVRVRPKEETVRVPLRYEVLLNRKHSEEARYATLTHELAHLYCGHLGTPNVRWWPDRRGLSHDVAEIEAESVCYLVCERAGIDNPSDEYISTYLKADGETPAISIDCIMTAAGTIEQMAHGRLPLRTVGRPNRERGSR